MPTSVNLNNFCTPVTAISPLELAANNYSAAFPGTPVYVRYMNILIVKLLAIIYRSILNTFLKISLVTGTILD